MDADRVLAVVCREMCAIGAGWRKDWSDFDGRTLRGQLDDLSKWAEGALAIPGDTDFTEGTQFLEGE